MLDNDLRVEQETDDGIEQDDEKMFNRRAMSARLTAIYRKQEQDPFNRETILGFPMLAGRFGTRKFCAPLFYFTVRLEHDPLQSRITIVRTREEPVVNTTLLSMLVTEEAELGIVRQQLLPLVLAETFDSQAVDKAVRVAAELVEGLRGLRKDTKKLTTIQEAIAGRDQLNPVCLNACVIINTPRSHAFLQDDLAALSRLKMQDGETVVDLFLSETDDAFVAVANFSTSEIQRKLENSEERLKKLKRKIDNLQARFSELKILEREKSGIFYQYHKIRQFDGIEPEDEVTTDDTAPLERCLLKWGKYLSNLAPVFAELHQFYLEEMGLKVGSDIEEVQKLLHELLTLYENTSILYKEHPEEVKRINNWVRLTRKAAGKSSTSTGHVAAGFAIAKLIKAAMSASTAVTKVLEVVLVSEFKSLLSDRVSFQDHTITALEAEVGWLSDHCERLAAALNALGGSICLGDACSMIGSAVRTSPVEILNRVMEAVQELQALDIMPSTVFLPADAVMIQRVGQALSRLEDVENSWLRWHLSPSVRGALNSLRELGVAPTSFASAAIQLHALRTWHKHWHLRYEIQSCCRYLRDLGLPVDVPSLDSSLINLLQVAERVHWLGVLVEAMGGRPTWKGPATLGETLSARLASLTTSNALYRHFELLKSLYAVAIARHEENRLASTPALYELLYTELAPLHRFLTNLDSKTTRQIHQLAEALLAESGQQLPTAVAHHLERLDRVAVLRQDAQLQRVWQRWLAPCARGLEESPDDLTEQSAQRLKELVLLGPQFYAYLNFANENLSSLSGTRKKVEMEIARKKSIPEWFQNPMLAIEAYRLRRLMDDNLATDPDCINTVAEAITKSQQEYRNVVLRVLDESRKLALKQSQNEPESRRTIIKLRNLLRRQRKTPSLLRLRDQIDYRLLLKIFPCWVMSIEDVARVFPLISGLFDYVIVDEASQCQQATALHLAYRSRRMVVVGDRQQLQNPNTRFLPDRTVQLLLSRHKLEADSVKFDARKSLLELAEYCAQATETLSEHFRCEPAIISWSNREFYDNQLIVLTPIRSPRFNPPLELRLVRGADDEPERKVNISEAKAVVEEVHRLILSGEAAGLSIGIISPYREQANLIHNLLHDRLRDHPDWIRRHQLVASTADGFQGDERDIILYSFRYGASTSPASVSAVERERERLNVAFTRARRKAICFISNPVQRFPSGLIKSFLEHVQVVQQQGIDRLTTEDRFVSALEREVCYRLRNMGYTVHSQVPCGPFRIDLVVQDSSGRRLAVECDGEFHHEDDGYLRAEDYQRQDLIERAGWVVYRVPARHFYKYPDATLASVVSVLNQQETEAEQALAQQTLATDDELEMADNLELGQTEVGQDIPTPEPVERTEKRPKRKTVPGSDTASMNPTTSTHFRFDGMELPENWFRLSRWSKTTGLLSGYNNSFCYNCIC
ncbi:MAG: AAA domain-containing protein [Bacillota bacterium]